MPVLNALTICRSSGLVLALLYLLNDWCNIYFYPVIHAHGESVIKGIYILQLLIDLFQMLLTLSEHFVCLLVVEELELKVLGHLLEGGCVGGAYLLLQHEIIDVLRLLHLGRL
jgi:hypothetical protein